MSKNYLTEAFKELDLLESQSFDVDKKGTSELEDFLEDDSLDDFEVVIDPEAETEEDLQKSYMGKVILMCDVCRSMIYKDPAEIVIDEESQLANVGELCPYCFTGDGYKIVGKVAPYEEVTVEAEKPVEVKVDGEEVEVEDKIEEEIQPDQKFPVEHKKAPVMEDLDFTDEAEIRKQLDKYSGQYLTITFKGSENWKHISDLLEEYNDGDEEEAESALDELESSYRKEYDLLKSLEVDEISEITVMDRDVVVTIKVKKDDLYRNYADLINNPSIKKDTVKILELELNESLKKRYQKFPLKESTSKEKTIKEDLAVNGEETIADTANKPAVKPDVIIIKVESSISADGFEVTVKGTDGSIIDQHSFRYGYNASYSELGVDKYRPFVTDIINLYLSKYNLNKDNIIVTKGRNAFKGTDVSDEAVADFKTKYLGSHLDESKNESLKENKNKSLKESMDDISITTEDQVIKIKSTPREDKETIQPVTETEVEKAKEAEEIDVDLDEIDEEGMNDLGESYLKSVYENVNGFKTSKAVLQGNKMILEGVISFTSGNKAKTKFIFESKEATKRGKLKFLGENKNISKNKKAFTLIGSLNNKKLMLESLNYNYTGKDSKTGKTKRLYGTIRRKLK